MEFSSIGSVGFWSENVCVRVDLCLTWAKNLFTRSFRRTDPAGDAVMK
jgi:hypothetical protein